MKTGTPCPTRRGIARLSGATARALGVGAALVFLGCSDRVVVAPDNAKSPDASADVSSAPEPPSCPPGPWVPVLLHDGSGPRWQCAPDFPAWGDQPLTPTGLKKHADGTATDSLTGLQWQSEPVPAALNLADAATTCDQLNLASHRDWRLPTVAELQTVVDYGSSLPAQAKELTTPAGPAEYWTLVERGPYAWTVEFERGSVHLRPKHLTLRTRCVRSADGPGSVAADRFTYKNKETVADSLLALEWLRTIPANTYTLPDTVGWCNKVNASGGGWRMPTLRQLSSIIDRTKLAGTVDGAIFGGSESAIWSYTLSAGDPAYAWVVDFSNGTISPQEIFSYASLRCVRDLK